MDHQQGTGLARRASLAVASATPRLPARMVGGLGVRAGAQEQRSAGIRLQPAAADRHAMERAGHALLLTQLRSVPRSRGRGRSARTAGR